jgi:hypothetical protein
MFNNKITKDLFNKIIIEINKNENKKILENEILFPLFTNIFNKMYPYMFMLFIMYSLNIILIISIIILIIVYK